MQSPSPLDEAQLTTLAQTRETVRKLRFARFIALSNVIGLGVFGVLSLLMGALDMSFSPMGLALVGLAWNEERGRRGLLTGDVRAAQRLAINQALLFLCLLVYCVYNAYAAWTGPSVLDSVLQAHPELPAALGDAASEAGTSMGELSEWGRNVALIVYGAVALGSLLMQGVTLLYYLSLRPTLATLAAAPAWARALSQ
jgi:hypothetical protein